MRRIYRGLQAARKVQNVSKLSIHLALSGRLYVSLLLRIRKALYRFLYETKEANAISHTKR